MVNDPSVFEPLKFYCNQFSTGHKVGVCIGGNGGVCGGGGVGESGEVAGTVW